MRVSANVLAMCLLALTSLPARCQHDETFTEDDRAKPLCKYLPHIQVFSESYHYCKFYDSDFNKGPNTRNVSVAYGTEVKVHCRGIDAEKLTFSRNDKKIIENKSDNSFTFNGKLDLQSSQYIFKCTDIETTCERSVNILVSPRFEVISPNVQTCFNQYCSPSYYVQYGDSVSVLCSGGDATPLVMSKDGNTLPTKRKNGTTIESFEMTPDLQISKYACSDVDTTHSTSVNIKVVPAIYFQSQNETITPYNMDFDCFHQKYYFQYSGSIEIFCSGPRAVKLKSPTKKNKNFTTANYNETTVFTNITKSGISEYITCADSEFSDYVQTVNVIVFNRMEVASPSVRLVGIERGVPKYTIIYGQPLEIVCSGSDASRLTISDLWGDISITNSVVQAANKSAIKYIRNNPVWIDFMTFTCYDRDERDLALSRIEVAVLPTVTNFRCMSYNLQFVNCTWTGTGISNTANNTLYYVADGIITRICDTPRTSRLSKFCKWDYEGDYRYTRAKVLTFLIHSCSFVACHNQTFQFDHTSIVKLTPPEGLTVLRTTSRGAVLRWRDAYLIFDYDILTGYYGDVDQKVQYWYPGIEQRDVNSSLVTCDNDDYCKIELNLPCPGQFYEVRIYHTLKTAFEEEFMSAPSSVTFYTDREDDNTSNNDPTCSQEPIKTKEVMRYIVRERRKEMLPEIQPMKRAVRALQEKLANIRKYIASIKEQDENK